MRVAPAYDEAWPPNSMTSRSRNSAGVVTTSWSSVRQLSRRSTEHAGATTPTLFLDLDVLEFGDQASAYAGAAPATLTARR